MEPAEAIETREPEEEPVDPNDEAEDDEDQVTFVQMTIVLMTLF
jgi:hypothetical protein